MAYTCITCRVVFHEPEVQRAHYKTDWHRYNLKRKVAELPTVTAEEFREKVLAQQSLAAEPDNKTTKVCLVCKKQFTTENSYSCHVRSKRHLEKAASDKAAVQAPVQPSPEEQTLPKPSPADEPEAETPIVVEEEWEPEPLEINECLFCSKKSEDMESSLTHMSKAHGFFIPDLDYIADVRGLISYLCEKVGAGCTCLYCNERGRAFHSVEAVQKHMVSKSHCKIFFEDEAAFEYAEFYDYSSSYPEGHDGPECQTLALAENSPHVNDDLELVLPSGVAVGHRALRYLYRQRAPTLEHRRAALVSRLLAQYRALGSREHCAGETLKRVRDQRWFGKMCQERDMKLGVRANRLQKHFRAQMLV